MRGNGLKNERRKKQLKNSSAVMLALGTLIASGMAGMPTAFAASSAPPIDSNGTVEVSTAAELEYIDANQSAYVSKNIELMNNIDLTGYSWNPFGVDYYTAYSGTFNGQGHEITGVTINDPTGQNVGFFGMTFGTIENVGIDAIVTSGYSSAYVGTLVGAQAGSIIDSYATGSVSGVGFSTGGLIGASYGSISDSYATVSVSGGNYTGGLVGWQGLHTSISDSYATGLVSGSIGGTVGGLVGKEFSSISGSYFDNGSNPGTGQNQGVGLGQTSGVTGESDSSMKSQSTFQGWDFTNTWAISSGINQGYPHLQPSVVLERGSLGTAGDTEITGLTSGNEYFVTIGTGNSAVTEYVRADGTLSANASDTAILTGTFITGLTNGSTYNVQIYEPTGLSASSTTSTATTLSWNALSGATSYNVYEGSTKIASNVNGISYTVGNLTPGKSYSFTVSGVNSSGESSQSSAATVTTSKIGSVQWAFGSTDVLNGTSRTVTGVVYDVYNQPVPYAIIDLSGTLGAWGASSVKADSSGAFNATWTAPMETVETSGAVTATVYGTVYGAVSNVTPTILSIDVAPLPSLTIPTLATEGSPYSQTLSVIGGFSPFTWSSTSGSLPAGLTFDVSTGVISGTPTTTGAYIFTVQAKDALGNTATQMLAIDVAAATSSPTASGSSSSSSSGGTSGSGSSGSGSTGGASGSSSSGGGTSGSSSSGSGSTGGASGSSSSSGGTSGSGSSGSGSTGGASGSSGTSIGTSSTTSPSLPTVLASQTFGNAGGTMQQTVGNMSVSLNVPQGAFETSEQMTVTTGTPASVAKLLNGLPTRSVATVLGVSFSGATPAKPVTVTITNPSIAAGGVMYKLTQSGGLVPLKATVSAGKATVSFTSAPDFVVLNVKPDERVITLAGHASIVPGMVQTDPAHGNKTTYMPIWYVMQMLKTMNISSTWDGQNWKLITSNQPVLGTMQPGKGSMHLYLNGTLVQNVTGVYARDPSTGKNTTYMPIWYVMQLLKTLNISSSWNGTTWTLTNNATQSGNSTSAN